MPTLKTQGTELYILDSTDTGNEVKKIGQITGGDGIGSGSATEIPATNLDSVAQEFVLGLRDNGTITINVDWDPQSASHEAVEALVGGSNVRWLIAASDGTTQPTFSTGSFTIPTDRTTFDFNGGVTTFPKSFSADEIWRGSFDIRVSGAITITRAV